MKVASGINKYWSIRRMPPCTVPAAGKGTVGSKTQKNKPRGDKAPILEVQNPVCPEERLDAWVLVHKDEHLKGYVEQVQLVDYDIHNYAVLPEFSPDQYSEWKGDKTRILKSFKPLLKSGITSQLHVPCFGNSSVVRKCVRLLLVQTHSRGIWLDRKIPINAEMIHAIMGLSQDGQDATDAFVVRTTMQKEKLSCRKMELSHKSKWTRALNMARNPRIGAMIQPLLTIC